MALVDRWLDENITEPNQFQPLLQPNIPYDLTAVQIDKPSTHNFLGSNTNYISNAY